ncbi:MAG: hypothetical protein ACJ8AK_12015 [Gemmatimonadaceae bacterium]
MIQGVGAQGTPQAPERPSMPTAEQRQALHDAARQMRDAIRANVNGQVINAQASAAAAKASAAAAKALRDQGVTIVGAPNIQGVDQDGPITIQTPDGKTTIVSRGTGAPAIAGPPPEVVDISIAFFLTVAAIVIFLPLARAFARRMDRRSAGTQVPPEVTAQLEHLNRAVDAIALEVERISEGQRFTTRLLTDQRESIPGLPTGANR